MRKTLLALIAFIFVPVILAGCSEDTETERQSEMQLLKSMGRLVVDAKDTGTKFEAPMGDNECHYFSVPAEGGRIEIPFNVPSAVLAAAYISNDNLMRVDDEKGIDAYTITSAEFSLANNYEPRSFRNDSYYGDCARYYYWHYVPSKYNWDGFDVESTSPTQLTVVVEPNIENGLRCMLLAVGWGYRTELPGKSGSQVLNYEHYVPSFENLIMCDNAQMYRNYIYIFQEGTEGLDSRSYWAEYHRH